MAITKAKGTLLKLDVATTLTTVGQLISITPPTKRSVSFEAKTLDQAGDGTPRHPSGEIECEDWQAVLYWDPELAVQAAINAAIDDLAKTDWRVLFVNAGASYLEWTTAGLSMGVEAAMGDGLKVNLKGDVDGTLVLTV